MVTSEVEKNAYRRLAQLLARQAYRQHRGGQQQMLRLPETESNRVVIRRQKQR